MCAGAGSGGGVGGAHVKPTLPEEGQVEEYSWRWVPIGSGSWFPLHPRGQIFDFQTQSRDSSQLREKRDKEIGRGKKKEYKDGEGMQDYCSGLRAGVALAIFCSIFEVKG